MHQKTPYLVGIAGGSGSGKTSFIRDLKNKLPETAIAFVSQDDYYIERDLQAKDQNGEMNFDLPTSIDKNHFYNDILTLIGGQAIAKTEYVFNNKNAIPKQITIEPKPILVIEGLFIFHYQEIKKLLNLSIFIDVKEELTLQRRLKRDLIERGYPETDVLYRWQHHVMPAYKNYLLPYRDDADIIVTNNSSYQKGLEVILNHLKSKIEQK